MNKGELKRQQQQQSEHVFYEANLVRVVTNCPNDKENKPKQRAISTTHL